MNRNETIFVTGPLFIIFFFFLSFWHISEIDIATAKTREKYIVFFVPVYYKDKDNDLYDLVKKYNVEKSNSKWEILGVQHALFRIFISYELGDVGGKIYAIGREIKQNKNQNIYNKKRSKALVEEALKYLLKKDKIALEKFYRRISIHE